jgi:hypothetical protein
MKNIIGVAIAAEHGDREGFDTLLDEMNADPEAGRQVFTVMLGLIQSLAARVGAAEGQDGVAVLGEYALAIAEDEAGLHQERPES